jgi:hypothetical protein
MLRKVPAREKKVASPDLLVPAARPEQGRADLLGAGPRKMGASSDPHGAREEKEGAPPGKELVGHAQTGGPREQVRAPDAQLDVANAHLDGRGGQAHGAGSVRAAADSGQLRRTGFREPATHANGSGPDITPRKPANAEEEASNAELRASNWELRTGKCEVRSGICSGDAAKESGRLAHCHPATIPLRLLGPRPEDQHGARAPLLLALAAPRLSPPRPRFPVLSP